MKTAIKSNPSKRPRLRIGSLFIAAGAALLHPALAQAHPGHSLGDSSVSHYVTSPYHLLVLLLVGAALIAGATSVERRLPRRLLRGGGVLVLVTAALYWGLGA